MYKQLSFVITAAIMLTAVVTLALYSETAHAATLITKNTAVRANETAAGSANMVNATTTKNTAVRANETAAGSANMAKK